MKRFLLFAGANYYACGGWGDFIDSFDSHKEAEEVARAKRKDWWQIVNQTTGAICDEG